MADTAISTISTTIVRRGHPITKYATLAAATYIPGDWVYYSATGIASAVDSGVSVLVKPVLVGFEPRVSSTKSRKDIDNQIAISAGPIIWGGWTGPLIIAATCEAAGGARIKGMAMMISNTAGDIEVLDDGMDPTGGCVAPSTIFIWKDQGTSDTVGYFLYK